MNCRICGHVMCRNHMVTYALVAPYCPRGCEQPKDEPDPATRKILAFDAESDGLYGPPFAIGAVVLDAESGALLDRFYARADYEPSDPWVREHVLPVLPAEGPRVAFSEMYRAFASWRKANLKNAEEAVHMGYIVEARVLREMVEGGHMGPFDGPYPLYDTAPLLKMAGLDPCSERSAAAALGIRYAMQEHNPIDDAHLTALVWRAIWRS